MRGPVQGGLGESSFAARFAHPLPPSYGWRFEKPAHSVLKKKPFGLPTKRWLVERPLAWLSHNRRLSKEYDRLLTPAYAGISGANGRCIRNGC